MSLRYETRRRLQAAVLWRQSGYDAYGQPIVGEPEEIAVRWVNKTMEVIGPNLLPISLDATVVTKLDIPIGSRMWLGSLEDWYATGSAGQDTNLMIVKFADKAPDIKNRAHMRKLGLMRFRAKESE